MKPGVAYDLDSVDSEKIVKVKQNMDGVGKVSHNLMIFRVVAEFLAHPIFCLCGLEIKLMGRLAET